MVATYWSVLVTVRMAHTEMTEMGISSEASTTSTHAMITRVRRARGLFLVDVVATGGGDAEAATSPPAPASSRLLIDPPSLPNA